MRKLLILMALWVLAVPARGQFDKAGFWPSLEPEFICDFADWTPADAEVTGSTQGFALHGRYAFVLHDKGHLCIFDMKKKRMVNHFQLEGNTSHCNNACFGVEKASRKSQFPLLYIASCGGPNCCYVTDVSLTGSRIVQKIFYIGTDYAGTIDWCLDAENGFIYTYGGRNGDYKLLKKFKLPKLSDSDENGEVHLTDADVLDVTRLDKGINIWQGSIVRGRYAFLPDGYAPHDLLLHVVDLEEKRIVKTAYLNKLVDEPEGIDIRDGWAYVVFHTAREPRHSKLWRFSLASEKVKKDTRVVLETTWGDIELKLYDATPLHRDNFLAVVRSGAYDSVLFHRVIRDFMIQGGDPDSRKAAPGALLGEADLPYSVPAEFRLEEGIYHRRGVLAAAREGDDVNPEQRSSAMQFYIVWGRKFDEEGLDKVQKRLDRQTDGRVKLTPEMRSVYKKVGGTPHLDGQYTVFGEVVSGLDVVDAIQQSATDKNDRPLEDIRILRAYIR